MKKDDMYILILGLGINIITAYFYFSNRNELIVNKFVITITKSFHFNCTPMVGLLMLVAGEFIVWESKNNNQWSKIKTIFMSEIRLRFNLESETYHIRFSLQ